MDELWKILNDKSWIPRFGEVTIIYQESVPVLVSRKDQRKLSVSPVSRTISRSATKDSSEPLDSEHKKQ